MLEKWIIYALLSAVFASLVTIFGKIGLKNIDATLATSVRAFVMFMVIAGVGYFKKHIYSKQNSKNWIFIINSCRNRWSTLVDFFFSAKSWTRNSCSNNRQITFNLILIFSLLFFWRKIFT
jgi:transporter family protein